MNILRRTRGRRLAAVIVLLLCLSSMTVFATGEQSSDNSLAALGIEDAEVSPEFYYSTTEYNVKVPAGTQKLTLNPQPSDVNAEIVSISGNELDNGNGTVTITVAAENGSQAVYTLHVTVDETKAAATEAAAQTEAATEAAPTEKGTSAAQTEGRQDDTIKSLNTQLNNVNEKLNMSMKILYGMIALVVLLLFIIINVILKNKDLKDDLREAENTLDFNTNEFARKEKTLSSDYYYAPVPEMQQDSVDAPGVALEKVQETTEQVFGNAHAQVQVQVKAPDEGADKNAPDENVQNRNTPIKNVPNESVKNRNTPNKNAPNAAPVRGAETAHQEKARVRKKKTRQPKADGAAEQIKSQPRSKPEDQSRQPRGTEQGQSRQPRGTEQDQSRQHGGTEQDQPRQPRGTEQGQSRQPRGTEQDQSRQPRGTEQGQSRQPRGTEQDQSRQHGGTEQNQPRQPREKVQPKPQRQVKNQNQPDSRNQQESVREPQTAERPQAAGKPQEPPKKGASKKQSANVDKPLDNQRQAEENPADIDVTMIDL